MLIKLTNFSKHELKIFTHNFILQGWGSPMNQGPPGSMMGAPGSNHLAPGGKGTCGPVSSQGAPPPSGNTTQQQAQPSNASPGPRSHTPPHQAYLKQHLQV